MWNLGDNDVNDTAYNITLTKTEASDGRITTTDGSYDVSGKQSVTLDFSDFSHGTGYHSSIGYTLQDADGNIISSYIAIKDVKEMNEHNLGESLSFNIDTEGAVTLSTFLIVHGGGHGFDVGEVDIDLSGTPTVTQGSLKTDWVYFSNQSLNKDGKDHLMEGGNRFYWEDLNNLGDHDFDDTTYNLDVFHNIEDSTFADKSSDLYDIRGESSLTLNFSDFSHSTGYHSSVGYYILDEAGNIIKSVIVAPDVKDVESLIVEDVESLIVDIDTDGGAELGTFIVVNGSHKGFEAGEVTISFDGVKPTVTQESETGTVTTDWIYVSNASENGDGKDHKAIVGNRESWEDMWNLGDNDVNDTAYTLTIEKNTQTDNGGIGPVDDANGTDPSMRTVHLTTLSMAVMAMTPFTAAWAMTPSSVKMATTLSLVITKAVAKCSQ